MIKIFLNAMKTDLIPIINYSRKKYGVRNFKEIYFVEGRLLQFTN